MDNVQAWLEAFEECHRHFEAMCARYETMKVAIESPRSAALDGMPRSGGNPVDTIGNALARLDALRQQIEEVSKQEQQLYEERDEAIGKISGKKAWMMQAVLRGRYLDLLSWKEITCQLFDTDENDLKFETKLRMVHEYSKKGREALDEILKDTRH